MYSGGTSDGLRSHHRIGKSARTYSESANEPRDAPVSLVGQASLAGRE
jgi:hypothetical protein